MDQLYTNAAGWLGWSDTEIMTTPVPRIEMALRGKVDFIKKTNPFGSSEDDEEARKLAEQKANPELAAQQLLAFVKQRQGADARHRPKPKKK